MSREDTVIVAVPGHLAVMVATDTGESVPCVHVGVGMTSPLDDVHVTYDAWWHQRGEFLFLNKLFI